MTAPFEERLRGEIMEATEVCPPCRAGGEGDDDLHGECIDPVTDGECCCNRYPTSTRWGS